VIGICLSLVIPLLGIGGVIVAFSAAVISSMAVSIFLPISWHKSRSRALSSKGMMRSFIPSLLNQLSSMVRSRLAITAAGKASWTLSMSMLAVYLSIGAFAGACWVS